MKKYLLVDTMNLMWRAAHVTRGDAYDRVGLALHIIINSIPFTAQKFGIDHVVFCYEGRSWRNKYYKPYKQNRKVAEAKDSADKREFKKLMTEAIEELRTFLTKNTNVSVLQSDILEADDLVAGWIQHHPEDHHYILSTDSDFRQLLAPNVTIYNGVDRKILTHDSVMDENGKVLKDKFVNPEFFLFEKIIRGDTSDNIHPAYPGARMKGTKNKVGIEEAFANRHEQSFPWINFMSTELTDHEGNTYTVAERFALNTLLIDLTEQPDYVRLEIDRVISEAINNPKNVNQIGIAFIKFCGKHELKNLQTQVDKIARLLAMKY